MELVPLTRGTLLSSRIFNVRSNRTRRCLRLKPLIFAVRVVPPGDVARGVCGTGIESLEDGAGEEALLEEDLRRKSVGMWSPVRAALAGLADASGVTRVTRAGNAGCANCRRPKGRVVQPSFTRFLTSFVHTLTLSTSSSTCVIISAELCRSPMLIQTWRRTRVRDAKL